MIRDLVLKHGLTETIEIDLYATDGGPYQIVPGDSGELVVFEDHLLEKELERFPLAMTPGDVDATVVVPSSFTGSFDGKRTVLFYYVDVVVSGGQDERPLEGTLTIEKAVLLPIPLAPVVAMARDQLRDHGVPFRSDHVSTGTTLPYSTSVLNIEPSSFRLQGEITPGELSPLPKGSWILHPDQGQFSLRLDSMYPQVPAGRSIVATGVNYEWFSTKALNNHVRVVASQYASVEGEERLAQLLLTDDIRSLLAQAAVVEGLWALLNEVARDIDVSSPEVSIPATQRFRQLQSMLDRMMAELERRESLLNVGMHRIVVTNLRRVSRTTNRYVPVYLDREYDDLDPPKRLMPPIDALGEVVESSWDDLGVI